MDANAREAKVIRRLIVGAAAIVVAGAVVSAQQKKPSPDGLASTEIGGKYVGAEPVYVGGKWIEISYGRPIKRGRVDLWGSGGDYGKRLNAGAPVWRAGADNSTYLMTQAALVINGKAVEPGGYTLFIDLKPNNWTFIVSNWEAQRFYNPDNRAQLWGAFGYTADKDVVRAPMTVSKLPYSMDELTWAFIDMSDAGGRMALMWDTVMATVPFTIAK
jgi:DUF2911 family protein